MYAMLGVLTSTAIAADAGPSTGHPAAHNLSATAGSIPIQFKLDKAEYVTLVVEDASGQRIRNLIAETQFAPGDNTVVWDGYDDAGVLVKPGTYGVRGLTHTGINLVYEFTAYSGGSPPWPTNDKTGGWLADHSCPLGAVFLPANTGSPYGDGAPQVLLTSLLAEAGSPLVWVGLDGTTLQRRQMWGWHGANAAARDAGKAADPVFYAYLVKANDKTIAIRGLKSDGGKADIVSFNPDKPGPGEPRHAGHSLAVHDGLVVFNAVTDDVLVFADVRSRKVLGKIPMPKVRALQFDTAGRLLVSSEGKVLRFDLTRPPAEADGKLAIPSLGEPTVLIADGLENPQTLAFNPAGTELFVADWGKSHQVKVFTPEGKPLRTIGKANDGDQLGIYDELKMQRPMGLAIDDRNQLWVVEATHLPKRISLWDATKGTYLRSHYGPPGYGGGGTIDATDKTRLFYKDHYGLIEFALDWKTGTAKPYAICVNGWSGGGVVAKYGIEYSESGPSRWGFVNERPAHINGRTYFTGSWQSGLRSNAHSTIWMLGDDHIAWPVGRIGGASFSWPPPLNQNFVKAMPKGADRGQLLVAWSDRNGNHKVDSDEYDIRPMPATYINEKGETKKVGGFVQESVYPDLSMTANWGLHVPPPTFDAKGVPIWDLSKAEFLVPPSQVFFYDEQFNWGLQVMPLQNGRVVAVGDAGFTGWLDRKQVWTYPTRAKSPPPMKGGEVVHATRLLGPAVKAQKGEIGEWFAVNGEKGNIFLMSGDGLYLQTLGGDMRTTPLLRQPKAQRGMVIDSPEQHISFEDEHFHPTITQTDAGEIYLVAGKEHSSIFRVDGFENIRRITLPGLEVPAALLAGLPEKQEKVADKKRVGKLPVIITSSPMTLDGNLADWPEETTWASLDARASAGVRNSGDKLYAAYRTGDPNAIDNDAANHQFMFKNGGALDLQIRSDYDMARVGQVLTQDRRLLIAKVRGKFIAVLFYPESDKTPEDQKVLYESPIGKVRFDKVVDVSDQIQVAQKDGDFEVAVPLTLLGLKPQAGREALADIGIIRGNGTQNIQRVYWHNTNTGMVSDIPSEARFYPANWGRFEFISDAKPVEGTIMLAPEKAKRGARQMQLKKLGDNEFSVGFWSDAADYLEWTDIPAKPGRYTVTLTYACGNNTANEFVFAASGESLTGKTQSTGGWDVFIPVELGEITLAGDRASFTLKAVSVSDGLMDFKAIELVPLNP